jgi:hypothetical protein
MKMDILPQANELAQSIKQTENSIKAIDEWINSDEAKKVVGSNFGWASHYHMVISTYSDGSGDSVDLSGYHNNMEILEAIKKVLEGRLERYLELFESL